MRHRLLFAYVALLALAACNQRPTSRTEIAARSSVPVAAAPACPPQTTPVCPPPKAKVATKPAAHARSHAVRSKPARQLAQRRAAPAKPPYRIIHRDDLGSSGSGYVRREGGESYDSYSRYSHRPPPYAGGHGPHGRPHSGADHGERRYGERRYEDERYEDRAYDQRDYADDGRRADRYGDSGYSRYERRESRSEEGYERGVRTYGSGGHAYHGSRESYSESGGSSYERETVSGGCCASGGGAAGYDGYGYLTWPGKVPAR